MNKNESVEELKEKIRDTITYRTESYYAQVMTQLSQYLLTHDITKTELAERMDVTPSQVSQMFGESNNFTFVTLAKIAQALDIEWKIELQDNS